MVRRQALSCAIALLATTATAQNTHQVAENAARAANDVILIEPYEAAIAENGTLDSFRLQALDRIDPAHPLVSDPNLQTFSMFGREDLIAATSNDYQPTACPAVQGVRAPIDEIVQRARKTSVVIINESHERSEHRGFTTALLAPLRTQGYTTLAMEALSNPERETPPRFYPSFLRQPGLPYLKDDDGFYIAEAAFGRLGRTAKRLGYNLIPYEAPHNEHDATMTPSESIAQREEAQASALAAWIGAHPGAKLIVHVGYHHAFEVPTAKGDRWMAMRLKTKTGIDPLTITQTTCKGGGAGRRLAVLPTDEPKGAFDIVVDHPTARFVRGRPAWRITAGDRPVTIPANLRPTKGWRVIEARPEGEPQTAVPMDRVAIRPGEDVALMLPPGRYRLRFVDIQQEVKREAPTANAGKTTL